MKEKIFEVLKRLLFSFVVIYGFNAVGSNFNVIIPFNIITISLITILGLPALFSLVLLFVLVF